MLFCVFASKAAWSFASFMFARKTFFLSRIALRFQLMSLVLPQTALIYV